jgi:hypothetical protein
MLKFLSKGKRKGLLNYNKEHNTSSLKEHISNEHPKVYRRWGLILV